MNLSKWTKIGRLVADPETKKTENGQLTKVRIAVNRKVGGEDQASFYELEGWDKVAERLATLKKWQPAYFEGEYWIRTWEVKDKSGNVVRDDDGKPKLNRAVSYRCYQIRYLTTKSEQATEEGGEEDAPW